MKTYKVSEFGKVLCHIKKCQYYKKRMFSKNIKRHFHEKHKNVKINIIKSNPEHL